MDNHGYVVSSRASELDFLSDMASYNTENQEQPTPAPSTPQPDKSKFPTGKNLPSFIISCPLRILYNPTSESDSIRIMINFRKFSLHYAVFTWTALFITLVLNHKASFTYLVTTTQITLPYFVLLRVLPDIIMLQKESDRQFLLFLVLVALIFAYVIPVLELILAQGERFLFPTLASTTFIVALHSTLNRAEDVPVNEEAELEVESLV